MSDPIKDAPDLPELPKMSPGQSPRGSGYLKPVTFRDVGKIIGIILLILLGMILLGCGVCSVMLNNISFH